MRDDGRWLALGAVAAVAAAGVVERSRRGSRTKGYREDEVNDLIEGLRKAQGHYGQKRKSAGEGYEFYIKMSFDLPDEVICRIPEEAIWQEIRFYAEDNLAWFVTNLRERYPWIAKEWETAGRSGGYLILFDEDGILSTLDNLDLEPESVRHSFRGQTPIVDPDQAKEINEAITTANQRLKDLEAIEGEVKAALKGFNSYLGEMETWEDTLECYSQEQDEDEDGEE